jgi:hypothetical protein
MSLVVAQATDEGPQIVSDTRVSFPDEKSSNFKRGTLKAIIVTRETVICFAGNVNVGLNGVRQFAKAVIAGQPVDNLLPSLLEFASDSQRYAEFIVASAKADSKLTRIRDRKTERELETAWIGDEDGFELFQRGRNKPLDGIRLTSINFLSPGAKAMSTLGDAMDAVIKDPSIKSVDDFCVRIAAKQGEFNYLPSSFIYVGRDLRIKPGDDLISKMAQPVAEGGYAVSVVEPVKPGIPAMGLNFPRARMGIIYLPLEFDEAQAIKDVSPSDFAKVVLDRFGVA